MQTTDSIASSSYLYDSKIWPIIAVSEFIIIFYLLYKRINTKKNETKLNPDTSNIESYKSVDINMDNIIRSINDSKKLYKDLSKRCHPDRYVNTDLYNVAEEIFQEISRNKRNYEKLKELQQKAINELSINF
jgi:hypothetical protein